MGYYYVLLLLIGLHWSAKKLLNKVIFSYTIVINAPLDKIGGIGGILFFWRSLLRIDQYDLVHLSMDHSTYYLENEDTSPWPW